MGLLAWHERTGSDTNSVGPVLTGRSAVEWWPPVRNDELLP
jgi:hypothetical protein